MSVNCPHCTKEVPDVVPQADFTARLKAKGDENKALADQLAALKPKADGYDTTAQALATAQAAQTAAEGKLTRYQFFVGKGLTDPKVTSAVEAIHAAEMAGKDEKDRATLDAWYDGDGQAHPVIKGILPKTTTTTTTTTAPPKTTSGLPNGDKGGAPPPTPQTKLTQAQIREYFSSPGYRALKPEEQRTKAAEMMGQAAAPANGVT